MIRRRPTRSPPGFHRCFSHFEAADGRFEDDTIFDLRHPFRRSASRPGDVFAQQLRSVAEGAVEIEVLYTIPCATGFITEHRESKCAPTGVITSRRIHICEVHDGGISAVTTYCNGGWDEQLRSRHAAEAPMIRP